MVKDSVPPLLCGPYSAPACKVGDRLNCKLQGRVVVAGFHQGPIAWPYARGRGRHRLVICGGLARALRREELSAVAHWWGVSFTTVWSWRQALDSGLVSPRPRRWTKEEDALVQALPPEDAAARTGRSLKAVYSRRNLLGVNAEHQRRRG